MKPEELLRKWRRERPAGEFAELVRGAAEMNGLDEEDLMAEAERTALEFQATLKDVKVDIPKGAGTGGYFSASKPNGGLLLTLRIDRPKPPAKPGVPYELTGGSLSLQAIGNEPSRKKKGESDEDFADRVAEWEQRMARRGEALVKHEAALERWQRSMDSWGDVLRAYASITGLAAAFGDTPIQVSLTPLQTDFFAGMGVLSLPSPDAVEPADDDLDDDTYGDVADYADDEEAETDAEDEDSEG